MNRNDFSSEICTDNSNREKTGDEIYENMIQERLYPKSTTKVFDRLKKVKSLQVCYKKEKSEKARQISSAQ